MTQRNAILIALVACALLVAPARAQYRVFWGAPGGFRYCGDYSPAIPVFDHATQLVAQLILSGDNVANAPASLDHLTPGGDDVLLDEIVIHATNGAGSSWGDFIGNVYTSAAPPAGYLFGRVIAQPDWLWYGVFDAPLVDAALGSQVIPPFTYRFTTNGVDREVGPSGCLGCLHPCPEPLLAVQPSNSDFAVTYHATDANASYQLQVSYDTLSGAWTNTGTNLAAGLAIASNHGPRAYFRVIKE